MQILLEAGNHLSYEVPVSYTQVIQFTCLQLLVCLLSMLSNIFSERVTIYICSLQDVFMCYTKAASLFTYC